MVCNCFLSENKLRVHDVYKAEEDKMILADKIIELRKKNNWSQEELAGMLGVSRQAISKWEGAQSTPDLDRILAMSRIFGVSTDYLIKDEIEILDDDPETKEWDSPMRKVSMEEANSYLSFRSKYAQNTAFGVFLCIMAINPLILSDIWGSSYLVSPIAFMISAIIVTFAVVIFIKNYFKAKEFEWLNKEAFETAYGVDGMLQEELKNYFPTYSFNIIIGVVLCILTFICFVASDVLPLLLRIHESVIIAFAFTVLSIGVFFLVKSGIIRTSYTLLLKEDENSFANRKKANKKVEKKKEQIMGIYWLSITAIYIGYSLITNAWGKSWIIWPVAGVICGVLYIALDLILNKDEE